ncbi:MULTISPECIES: YgcG family protein [Caballeronia]|uniref:TPM domain-containing protein n=1 Tax=Caballeronia sp. AZ10_KS36 TaxID=2921757 RepID=UPI001F34B3CF|nr:MULTISPECIES: YgcG family protein [Caballeronia]MCE4547749.1 YgcG family protein [Caballeronia sp. PC1]MCE4575697.1 YgcG family protein [Caballeronia sp. CLC5]
MKAARIVFFALVSFWLLVANADVAIPTLTSRVTDETKTLTTDQRAALEQTLQKFEANKGSQLSVLIVPTTRPETIEQYSIRVVEQWKLGRQRIDDGALLIVAKNDRTLRIEVGYGLEGSLNDATSHRIIDEVIVPKFRQGDFYGGITAGVDSMMNVINGEPLPAPDRNAGGRSGRVGGYLPILFVLTLALGGVLRSIMGRLPGSLVTGGAVAGITWVLSGTVFVAIVAGAIALVFTLVGGGMGAYVGGRAIGGRGGGSGRSPFRGGGGGFGGGGASGRW